MNCLQARDGRGGEGREVAVQQSNEWDGAGRASACRLMSGHDAGGRGGWSVAVTEWNWLGVSRLR